MFILSFSISFVCLVVILLILCIIPLWDSATVHSPSGKELNSSSQEDTRFSGRCTTAYNFRFILCHPSLYSSQFLWAYCFANVFTLSCLASPWFGTHPHYLLNLYVYFTICGLFLWWKTAATQNILFYVWSISIAKDRCFAEKCRPRLWWS